VELIVSALCTAALLFTTDTLLGLNEQVGISCAPAGAVTEQARATAPVKPFWPIIDTVIVIGWPWGVPGAVW
jgi:hypothetical protein